jgi:hypothetical protein
LSSTNRRRCRRAAEIRLWVVEGDDLDEDERAALHDSIRESFEDAKAGRTMDAAEFAAKLRDRS